MREVLTRLVLPLFTAAFVCQAALAHDWRELDVREALDQADGIVAVAEAVHRAWAPIGGEAVEAAGSPPELRWWTWIQQRRTEGGEAEVLAVIAALAPAWLERGDPPEVIADWWVDALGELVAHAAARGVDDAARAEAMDALRRAGLEPGAAARASWIAQLPVLTEAERRELAPAFARLDALLAEVPR